jgi:hypothetical protein
LGQVLLLPPLTFRETETQGLVLNPESELVGKLGLKPEIAQLAKSTLSFSIARKTVTTDS